MPHDSLSPYRAPQGSLPPPPAPSRLGACATLAAAGLGVLTGCAGGLFLGWALFIGPRPGPDFHLAFPAILACGGALGALGGVAGALLARRLRGKSNRRAPAWGGLALACGGVALLGASLRWGPFWVHSVTSTLQPDGTYRQTLHHWDHLLSGALLLSGLGLALWGWRRGRRVTPRRG